MKESTFFAVTGLLQRMPPENSQTEGTHRAGYGLGGGAGVTQNFHALARHTNLPALPLPTNPEVPPKLCCLEGFMEASVHRQS